MPSPTLPLRVSCDTAWGEQVAVLGSWNAWSSTAPHTLFTDAATYPVWNTKLPLPPGLARIEYKYAIVRDASIVRWEPGCNRIATIPPTSTSTVLHVFGSQPRQESHPVSSAQPSRKAPHSASASAATTTATQQGQVSLDALERALVANASAHRSWRERLSFVRSLFTDREAAAAADFTASSLPHLATVAAYLTYLSTGQLPCTEDGGHHRPNHHAHQSRLLDAALARAVLSPEAHPYAPHVARAIFPRLPSYAAQFTVSVPLTRIRDIAHRGDIPQDLKHEIKHTLQNKLHRCAGPEDLATSERILARINSGGFSQPFVDQFRIFHAELREFFNSSSLDDRLRYLQHNAAAPVPSHAETLLQQKHERGPALQQMETLTLLREGISNLPLMQFRPSNAKGQDEDELPSEDVQKTRLADIDLEGYAFLLLAGVAKDAEAQSLSNFDWKNALLGLSLALRNVGLSNIRPDEVNAAADELMAVRALLPNVNKRRVKAAVDRALRFAESFSSAISDVYGRRATSIGHALGVDHHSVTVFAEAEIRSNITFQGSRIADRCSHVCRMELNLPPWDPLFTGKATGKLVHVEHLSDLPTGGQESVIAVCREAEGDEDIPPNVRGVVLGRSIPHLSHLGVRARQAGVVFVCAEDRDVFNNIWIGTGLSHVCMTVSSTEGLASLGKMEQEDEGSLKSPKAADKTRAAKKMNIKFDGRVKRAIPLVDVTKDTGSSKSAFAGKLCSLALESDGLFEAADGIALPHGIFQGQLSSHSLKYNLLVKAYEKAFSTKGSDRDAAADAVSEFIKCRFRLDERLCKEVQCAFPADAVVMVRSSANAEDLEDMSGAGLYDSIANVAVHDTAALQKATAAVWASLWTRRAASSRGGYGVAHEEVSMAVLVQNMVKGDASFVGFSRDPVGSGGDSVYVEMAVGMGETLASATSAGSPYRFRVGRETSEVETVGFASFSEALIARRNGDGLQKEVVRYNQEALTCDGEFREQVVRRIAQAVMMVEKAFDGPQDIEGCVVVEEDCERVFVVQARAQIM